MPAQKTKVYSIGLSKSKLNELENKLLISQFEINQVNNIKDLNADEIKDNGEILIVSGEDLNLDLFKENLKKAEDLEISAIALMPLKDMDLLISNFSRNTFDFSLPPHDVNEIFLRIINGMGKSGRENKSLIIVGPLIINQESYEVTLDGEKIDLTFKEYELLKYLASNPGRVFSREALLEEIWSDDYFGGTRTVDVHIRRIRSKIDDIKNQFIQTQWNVGYRFRSIEYK